MKIIKISYQKQHISIQYQQQQQYNNNMNQNKEQIKQKLNKHRKAIEAMLKQFKYNQEISHGQNMKILCSCLESVMNIDDLSQFVRFISNKDHLPIQINFRMLRVEKLEQLFDDWLLLKENTSSVIDNVQPGKYRNMLFKTILMDEREMIDEYFSTISKENKLKGFDLYQLLTNLLSSHFLYEKYSDTLTFFQKVNSFETFLQVVNKFLENGRLFSPRNKISDKSVSRNQFEMLIQFWQQYDPELTLLDSPRKNLCETGVQTNSHNNLITTQTQTSRQSNSSLLSFINSALHDLNVRIQKQDNPILLKSLNNMLNSIREQKIKIAEIQQYFHKDHSGRKKLENGYQYNIKKRSVSPIQTPRSRTKTPNKNQLDNEKYFSKIFDSLCRVNNNITLNSSQLQIFFYHIGLVKAHENFLIRNLIRNGFIQSSDDISYAEFKIILKQIAKQSSKKLNNSTLRRYIQNHLQESQNELRIHQKTHNESYSRSEMYGLFDRSQNHRILSKSTYNIDSEQS